MTEKLFKNALLIQIFSVIIGVIGMVVDGAVWLEPYGMVYPDFTFLSERTRRIVYWEHEGMMDNADYAKAAVRKIELYEKNGIFPSEDLILTFETSTSGINMELVKKQVQRYLV